MNTIFMTKHFEVFSGTSTNLHRYLRKDDNSWSVRTWFPYGVVFFCCSWYLVFHRLHFVIIRRTLNTWRGVFHVQCYFWNWKIFFMVILSSRYVRSLLYICWWWWWNRLQELSANDNVLLCKAWYTFNLVEKHVL